MWLPLKMMDDDRGTCLDYLIQGTHGTFISMDSNGSEFMSKAHWFLVPIHNPFYQGPSCNCLS